MKLFILLIFCLISASVRADEELVAVEDFPTSTGAPIFDIKKDETTTDGRLFPFGSENTNTEDEITTTESSITKNDEEFPDETTTVVVEEVEDVDDDDLLPNTTPAEESSTTEATTLSEQDETPGMISVRSEDAQTETEDSPASTLNPNSVPKVVQFFSDLINSAQERGAVDWSKVSSPVLEQVLRNNSVSDSETNFMKKYADRFIEAMNRVASGQKDINDETVIKALTDLPKGLVERMVNDNSYGLTAKEGTIIKKLYDDALLRMNEASMKFNTVPPTLSAELPETTPEKETDSTTLPPQNEDKAEEEDSTKPQLKDENLSESERAEISDEPESEEMDRNQILIIMAIATGGALLLLCAGIGLCCCLRRRGRSGRSNFKA